MAREQVCKKSVLENGNIRFEFADDGEAVVINPASFKAEIQSRATIHGFSQKLGDSYSGADGDAGAARKMFTETLTALQNGDWTHRAEGGPRVSALQEALARAKGITVETAGLILAPIGEDGQPKPLDEAALKKLRAHPAIKKAAAEIRLEKAQKAADKAEKLEEVELDL